MSTVTEVDVETGETRERPLTADEQKQQDADRAAAAAAEQAEKDAEAARVKAEQDWRGAVSAVDTSKVTDAGTKAALDRLKAVLLGTNLPAQPDVRSKS